MFYKIDNLNGTFVCQKKKMFEFDLYTELLI